jgi:hypothetical protein
MGVIFKKIGNNFNILANYKINFLVKILKLSTLEIDFLLKKIK